VSVRCWVGSEEYSQFVANWVRKIGEHTIDEWRYASTAQNPAGLGSRGRFVVELALWWDGPLWLEDRDAWPENPVIAANADSDAEPKVVKELLAPTTTNVKTDRFDQLLGRHDFQKPLRTYTWIARFMNYRRNVPKFEGSITAAEQESQTDWWIWRVQARAVNFPKFTAYKMQLNLQTKSEGILECLGTTQGCYPAYLPDDCLFTEKFGQRSHRHTLHGGVALTMAGDRESHWVLRLRQVVKKPSRPAGGIFLERILSKNWSSKKPHWWLFPDHN